MEYLKRIIDKQLALYLKAFGAVQIKGPKWCGKTTTAMEQAKSMISLQNPDTRTGFLATAAVKPSLLLKGDTPRLIDEWQVAPVLWDAVRHAVDTRRKKGQFILTGSTVIETDEIMHTGIGRIAKINMYPMSLFESNESNGSISLKKLFDNPKLDIDGKVSSLTIEQLIFAACRGGWPSTLDDTEMNDETKLLVANDYVDALCKRDISAIDKKKRNENLTRLILKSYGRNVCTLAKKKSLLKDVHGEMETVTRNTFDEYVDILEKLYIIEDIEAWCPAIRSASAIRSGKKRCFIDPSIAVASIGASPASLELDLHTFGFIFECLIMRDLKVYSQSLGGRLSYYHDRYDLEADAVLHLSDGRFALIECKLGSHEIEEGAEHLLHLRDLIREKNKKEKQVKLREPDLLIVITGGTMAYTRQDGVKIIPIGCLRD